MSLRVFQLDGSGSQTIAISQVRGTPTITVSLNDRVLGTLTAPKGQSANSDFTLDDGSVLTVRLAKRQARVLRNGLPLFPVTSRAAASGVLLTKRIMLTCAILAPIMGMAGFFISLLSFASCYHNPDCETNQTLRMLPSALLGAGYTLLPLVACAVGILSALATHRWKWLVFGLGLLLLQIWYLIWLVGFVQDTSFSHDLVSNLEGFFLSAPLGVAWQFSPLGLLAVSPLLASATCLVYVARLE